MRKSAVYLLIASLVLLAAGCSYHLMGSVGLLPSTVKTIAVLPFQRRIPVLQLDQRVTEAVTREVARRMKVRVQSSRRGADAILTGAITAYHVVPISFNEAGRANRYRVTMAARVKLVDTAGKVLYKSDAYHFREIYARSSGAAGYINEEVVAYDIVAADFARALVASILEGGEGGR